MGVVSKLASVESDPAAAARLALEGAKRAGIHVEEEAEILEYLQAHGDVLQVIPPMIDALQASFRDRFEVSLEYFRSRSIADAYPVFFIRTKFYEDLMPAIREFREKHENLFSFSSGWLGVTTDFAVPRKRV